MVVDEKKLGRSNEMDIVLDACSLNHLNGQIQTENVR